MIITKEVLENSKEHFSDCYFPSRLEYVGEHIIEICTYETEILEKLTRKCLEVARALTDGTTFDYYKKHPTWYLVCMNFPFFASRTEWGTSIRGSWWEYQIKLNTCGIYHGFDQIREHEFNQEQWNNFIYTLCEYCEV